MSGAERGPVIAIRCDGNAEIATGHLARCYAVAEALTRAGAQVRFFFADEESERLFRWKDTTEYVVLGTDLRDPLGELPALARALAACGAEALLIDSYFVKDGDLLAIREAIPGVRLCVLDDYCSAGRPADLLINYLEPGRQRYVPLRSQFASVRMPFRDLVKTVFLSSGGSDPYGMKELLMTAIRERFPGLVLRIPQGVDEMAAFMADCDLAVTAGGTTVYELCAVGVPAVMYTMADNQRFLAAGVRDALPVAGDVREEAGRRQVVQRILSWLEEMIRDPLARRQQSAREMALTDGQGAARIADKILALVQNDRS